MQEEESPPGTVMYTSTPEDSPPDTIMDTSTPADDVGSSNISIKSPTPSQKAREWEKRINQSMGGKYL